MKRRHSTILSVIALTLLLAGVALAHAKFVKSEPAPDSTLTVAPKQVTIWFNEELDTKLSTIKVFDAANVQVDAGNSKVNLDDRKQLSVGLKPLANGVYTVKWHAVSDDDKGEADGEFKFTVRAATTPTVPAYPPPTTAASPTALPTTVPTVAPPTAASPIPQATRAPTTAAAATTIAPPATSISHPATPIPPATTNTSNDLALPLIVLLVIVLGVGSFLVLRRR